MALSDITTQREHDKFIETGDGGTAVNVVVDEGNQIKNKKYVLIDVVKDTDYTYLCTQAADDDWYFKRWDKTNYKFQYASQQNNPSYTTYAAAFAVYSSLTYSDYKDTV